MLTSTPLTPSKASVALMDTPLVRAKLRDALDSLQQKDQDLALAADIGQTLLESNQTLQAEILKYSEKNNSTSAEYLGVVRASNADSSTNAYISELEKSKVDLTLRVQDLETQIEVKDSAHEKVVRLLDNDVKGMRGELHVVVKAHSTLEDEKSSLIREKEKLTLRCQELSVVKKPAKTDREADLERRLNDSELVVAELVPLKDQLEEHAKNLAEDNSVNQERIQELEQMLETEREHREESDYLRSEFTELSFVMEQQEAVIDELRSKLSSFTAKADAPSTPGSKTLLSELDDQRQDIAASHSELSVKHTTLLRAHTQTLHAQERLRNHVQRLTQLSTHGTSDETRIKRLEALVSEREYENKDLRLKNERLEKNGGNVPSSSTSSYLLPHQNSTSSSPSSRTRENLAAEDENAGMLPILRLRISSLETSQVTLKKELRTLQMLKLGETEKVRNLEAGLWDRNTECEKLRAECANLNFLIEDRKMSEENMIGFVTDESEVVTVDLDMDRREEEVLFVDSQGGKGNLQLLGTTPVSLPKRHQLDSLEQKPLEYLSGGMVAKLEVETESDLGQSSGVGVADADISKSSCSINMSLLDNGATPRKSDPKHVIVNNAQPGECKAQ